MFLLGPPGAGKGTQATRIVTRLCIPPLSTGEMLRDAVASGTEAGLRVRHMMDRGELVPDDVVVSVVASRIDHSDAASGFILDGFPRTLGQAKALDQELANRGIRLDAVLELEVDADALLDRIRGRAEEAANRGEPVRSDDNAEVFKTRLDVYRTQTVPITDYYRAKGLLKSVDGLQSIDAVTDALTSAIMRLTGNRQEGETR